MKVKDLIKELEKYPDYDVVIEGIEFRQGGYNDIEIEDPDININSNTNKIYIEGYYSI